MCVCVRVSQCVRVCLSVCVCVCVLQVRVDKYILQRFANHKHKQCREEIPKHAESGEESHQREVDKEVGEGALKESKVVTS